MSEEKLNLPERLLAIELATPLARKLDDDLDRVDGEIYNIGQSNYECACYALDLVGVYQQAQHYTRHKVTVPVERVEEHMAELKAISREAFDTLLSAFIVNFIHYGSGELTGYRSVFPVPKHFVKALKLLVSCGYAEQSDIGFRWTDKIAPTMRRWHIWDDSGVCKQEQIALREDAIVAKLENTIPTSARSKLLAAMRTDDSQKPYNVLQAHLNGDQWLQLPLSSTGNTQIERRKELSLTIIYKFLRRLQESP